MSIFFQNPLDVKGKPRALALTRAKGSAGVVAVAQSGSTVALFTLDGRPLVPGREAPITNPTMQPCTSLSWSPTSRLLAVGWGDGGVALWSEADRRQREDRQGHTSRVTTMRWTADGSRLVTGDVQGTLAVWTAEGGLHPALVAQYKEPGAHVDHVLIAPLSSAPPEFMEDGAGQDAPCMALVLYAAYSTETGESKVFMANDQGNRMRLFKAPGRLRALHWLEHSQQAVLVDERGGLSTWARDMDGWSCQSTVRIPGLAAITGDEALQFHCAWCGDKTLAIATSEESAVRMYDPETQDNFKLELPASAHSGDVATQITALAVGEDGALAVGTNTSAVAVWSFKAASASGMAETFEAASEWRLQGLHHFTDKPEEVYLGPGGDSLAVVSESQVLVMRSALPQCSMGSGLACVQISATELSVDSDKGGHGMTVEAGIQIRGVSHTRERVLVWSGTEAQVYDLTAEGPTLSASFPRYATSMAMGKDAIFECSPTGVNLLEPSGVTRMTLPSDHMHGPPVCLDLRAEVLAIVTREGFVDLYRTGLKSEPPVSLGHPRRLALSSGSRIGMVESCRLNATGTLLSMICSDRSSGHPPGRVFVYDIAGDVLMAHDVPDSVVVSHAWDIGDERLLGVESEGSAEAQGKGKGGRQVTLLFVAQGDIHHFDTSPMGPRTSLLGLKAPDIHVFARPEGADSADGEASTRAQTLKGTSMRDMGVNMDGAMEPRVQFQRMSPFSGLEDTNPGLTGALLGFSFHTAAGNHEEAFKVAKGIDDLRVWESLAQMCIKTRRLDVAEHCLGNMGHVQGARALREAREEPDVTVRVALVAVHLGLMEDAEELLEQAEQWGRLIELYIASGDWDRALFLAENKDRVSLKPTHYQYAKHLEDMGRAAEAIKHYELSGTHTTQVPRMLLRLGEVERLRDYVMGTRDSELLTWWARYCEATGDIGSALQVYEMAGNHVASVKLRCMAGELEAAEQIVENTMDPAAAFQLAVQYESMDLLEEAIRFFVKANRPAYALRLAIKLSDDAQIAQLAARCPRSDQLAAARRMEAAGDLDRAVRLYQMGGNQAKALELCFRLGRYDALEQIAADLDTNSDPGILMRCAEFLVGNGQAGRALRYLAMAGEAERVLDMVEMQVEGAILDEDIVELLTPEKGKHDAAYREQLLTRIAEACLRQGHYHLACKKFTQAGDKRRGMRALLRSGDKDKIVFFATVSRDREVYRMAANFLQALDWRSDPEVTKNIIGLYTKAKDFASLAAFYESCAQMEIDEFRDYERALGAMRDAAGYLEKAGPDHALSRASLEDRQAMVEHYIRARAVLGPEALEGPLAPTAEETAEAERICRQLIAKAPEEVAPQEASIRLGDVFALMVEHKHATGDLRGAHALLSEMRQRDLVLAPYIDSKILGEVFAAVGETAPRTDPGMGAGADRFAEDEVESDIEEERVIEESVASDSDEGF